MRIGATTTTRQTGPPLNGSLPSETLTLPNLSARLRRLQIAAQGSKFFFVPLNQFTGIRLALRQPFVQRFVIGLQFRSAPVIAAVSQLQAFFPRQPCRLAEVDCLEPRRVRFPGAIRRKEVHAFPQLENVEAPGFALAAFS
jgi:hypothetical protein